MLFENNDPIIVNVRKGDMDSPFKSIEETLIIDNSGKVTLTEIPDDFSRLFVEGDNKTWIETDSDNIPLENEYVVDYLNRTVIFHKSNIGKQLKFSYKGTGLTFISANQIYTERDGLNVKETLGEIIEAGRNSVENIQDLNDTIVRAEKAIDETKVAIVNTNNAASTAESKATLAQEKIDSLSTLENQIKNTITSSEEATANANNSATNATTQADFAKSQGDYAKQQGDLAAQIIKDVGESAGVTSINGMTGAIELEASDVGAIPSSEKGIANGVATLNAEGKVVDALGNEVEGKVKSVNNIEPDGNGNITVPAFSGNYEDLTNKPTIPSTTSQLTNDSNFATNTDVSNQINLLSQSIPTTASQIALEDTENLFTSTEVEGALVELFTNVSNGKGLIATAITDKGITTSSSDTFSSMANKISQIETGADVSGVTAVAGDVISGKKFITSDGALVDGSLALTGSATTENVLAGTTFYNTDPKTKLTGTMVHRGSKGTILPGTSTLLFESGYYNTFNVAGDVDLIASNIKSGVNIFGVTGNYTGRFSVVNTQITISGQNAGYLRDFSTSINAGFPPKQFGYLISMISTNSGNYTSSAFAFFPEGVGTGGYISDGSLINNNTMARVWMSNTNGTSSFTSGNYVYIYGALSSSYYLDAQTLSVSIFAWG